MATPLFTEEECDAHKARFDELERNLNDKKYRDWSEYWGNVEGLRKTIRIETVNRVEKRAEEFLNALLVLVGSRGTQGVDFREAFSQSDTKELKELVSLHDTPIARRNLLTIFRALIEVPKSWGRSAFLRFLRGRGKQKGAKYHGAGMFGTDYGWKEDEVALFCDVIAGGRYDNQAPYAAVLVSYADVEEEIREEDPDFEVTDHVTALMATHAERNIPFLERLCTILEIRGLSEVKAHQETAPKKEHIPKIFKSGDVIRKNTLRDLPLPAYVRIPIERLDEKSKQWISGHLEQVVMVLGGNGSYMGLPVGKDGKAYKGSYNWEHKSWLEGAVYLGPWNGEIVAGKVFHIKFRFRRPSTLV